MYKEKIRSQILEGSLQDYPGHMSGRYRGYYVSIQVIDNTFEVKINASLGADENNRNLAQFLKQQENMVKQLLKTEVYSHTVTLHIRMANLGKNIPKVLNETLEPIFQYLVSGGYVSGCEECGRIDTPVTCYEINGRAFTICNDCRGRIEEALVNHQEQKLSQKSNLAAGLVGAFLGSLIGGVLWILIYKLGYIAGIAGAVTGICAMKGYEMLGKHLDRKGVIGSVIIMVITIFLANKIAWSWEAYDALKTYGWTFSECFRNLGYILEESEITGGYYADLFVGYALTLVCTFRSIIQAFKSSAGKYTIK